MNNENLKPFQPGQSGNPAGRPRLSLAIAELARNEIERRGLLAKLGAIASRKGSQQVRAIELLLAYAYGRPKSELAVEYSTGTADLAELREVLMTALADQSDEVRHAIARKLFDAEAAGGQTQ